MFPNVRAGAVLYTKDSPTRNAMALFARDLINRGWRVGGLVQEIFRHESGYKTRVDIIDISTGDRIPINRPTKEQIQNKSCSLDLSALTQSSTVLRNAIEGNVDLLVVEKFGEQEQKGGGLGEEILAAMVEGIPTLVSVPAGVIDQWNDFSGGSADLLPCDLRALWRWWGARNLREELIRGVGDVASRRVIVGMNWTLVEGPDGCGLAHSPTRNSRGCKSVPSSGQFAGRPLSELARLAASWNPFEAAIGVAALNAHYNRYDLDRTDNNATETNGLDVFGDLEGTISVVGRFPSLAKHLDQPHVIEYEPREGEYPVQASATLLAESEAVLITSSALVNHTLEGLLQSCPAARVALVGPGTPLASCMHAYGIEILAGQIIEDPDGAANVIAEGGSVKELRSHCRFVTLKGKPLEDTRST